MENYCVSSKKNATEISSVSRTKQNRLMLVVNCAFGGTKKSRFIKYQEASRSKTLINST